MHKQKNTDPLREAILKEIEAGKLSMKPRWHFILGSTLMVIGVSLTILVVIYLTSLFVFTLQESGLIYAPQAGSRGIMEFLRSMPWVLVSGAFIFLIILEVLVRKYRFAYKKPLLYSGLGVLVLGVVGGIIAAPAHKPLHEAALKGRLPVVGSVYRDFGAEGYTRLTRCKVIRVEEPNIFAEGPRKEPIVIHTNDETELPDFAELKVGTQILVIGERDHGEIEAYKIRIIAR